MEVIFEGHLKTQKLECFKNFEIDRSRYIVTQGRVPREDYGNSKSSTTVNMAFC